MGRLYQRQDAIESEKYAEICITPLRYIYGRYLYGNEWEISEIGQNNKLRKWDIK